MITNSDRKFLKPNLQISFEMFSFSDMKNVFSKKAIFFSYDTAYAIYFFFLTRTLLFFSHNFTFLSSPKIVIS